VMKRQLKRVILIRILDIEMTRNNGFVNYYGMQRFGTRSIPTHEVGKAIIKEDWAGAVKLILSQYDTSKPGDKQLREYECL